jgi:MarR family transcriptional regulator, organic hydroperoxide resistance regulator
MNDHPTLAETERVMREHVEARGLDFEAAHAVSSIYRAANAVRSYVWNDLLRPHDLTWTGFVVLWVVWIFDGMETRHAAEAAAISKGTLTGVVKTLEARGWIEKVGRTDDRRLVELHLTDEGKTLMEEIYPQFNAIETKVVGRLSGRETKGMTRSLREIVTTIEETGLSGETP